MFHGPAGTGGRGQLTVVVGRNGSGKSSFAEALEVLLTGELRRWETAVGMMDKLVTNFDPARPDRHLQGVESKLGAQRIRYLRADDPAGKQISDERSHSSRTSRADASRSRFFAA